MGTLRHIMYIASLLCASVLFASEPAYNPEAKAHADTETHDAPAHQESGHGVEDQHNEDSSNSGQSAAGHAERIVFAYNVFGFAPFVSAEGGLAKDLIEYLNHDMHGEYRFVLQNLSHSALIDTKLKSKKFDGVGLFLSPDYIGRINGLLWSGSLFDDTQVLVFRTTSAPRDFDVDGLSGLVFGAVNGMSYPVLDRLAADNKTVRRDFANEAAAINQLLAGKVDMVQVPASHFAALSAQKQYTGRISAVPLPGSTPFHRRMVFGVADPVLAARVEIALARMAVDPEWAAVVKKYGLAPKVASPSRSAPPPAAPASTGAAASVSGVSSGAVASTGGH